MTKCNDKIKLNVWVIRKSSALNTSSSYSVMKSVYARTGDRHAIQLPSCIASSLTVKEAHALKRQVINDYFG